MSRYILCALAVAAIAMGVLGASAQATVITPSAVSYWSAQYQASPGFYCASNVIKPYTDAQKVTQPNLTDPSTWYVSNVSGLGWEAGGTVKAATLVFDLGSAKDVGYIWLWNQFQSNPNANVYERAVQHFRVYKCDNADGTGNVTEIGGGQQTLAAYSLTSGTYPNPAGNYEYGYNFALTGASSVRYVKLDCLDVWGTGDCAGLGLVSFAGPVPEPGTLALLAAGLVGLLCYAWRKRK